MDGMFRTLDTLCRGGSLPDLVRFALARRALAAVLLFLPRGGTGRPREAAPARVILLGGADAVLVEFVGQGAARESHSAGGFGLRSTGGREGLEDELFLGVFGRCGEIEHVGNRANKARPPGCRDRSKARGRRMLGSWGDRVVGDLIICGSEQFL